MSKYKLIVIMLIILLSLVFVSSAGAVPPDKPDCTTIQDGVMQYSSGHYLEGQPLMVGYDDFGYNYQAHLFNGSYFNSYAGGAGFPPWIGDDATYLAANPSAELFWAWPYRTTDLMMKWDQNWLANVDCDEDGLLDRYYGFDSYIGSGAWLTNHMWGSEENPEGNIGKWDYFVKIIAAPADAYAEAGNWYNAAGVEIGPVIWGDFAIIQDVTNDPCLSIHGIQYLSPDHGGFGGW